MNKNAEERITTQIQGVSEHLCEIQVKLDQVIRKQVADHRLLKEIKHMNAETTAILGRLDAATNAIAAKLQALIDKAAQSGSVTEAEVRAALEPEVAKLEGLAADPADPVPA